LQAGTYRKLTVSKDIGGQIIRAFGETVATYTLLVGIRNNASEQPFS
jgi:hypothetical protein